MTARIPQSGFTFTKLGLALLVPALFFEADAYSVSLPFGRVRLYHTLIILLFGALVWSLATGKKKWRKTPLDWPLLVYVGLNWATIAVAPNSAIAFKIAGLITLLALLYWTITNNIVTRADFMSHAKLLLWSTMGIALFGLFQVFAVWFASRFDINLWNGVVIHSDILPYGRPYGTFVEPDWFGTIIAAAFAGLLVLSFSKAFKRVQVELLLGSLVLLIATILSGVRGGWLAVAIAVPVALIVNRLKLKLLDTQLILDVAVVIAIVLGIGLAFTPTIREALVDRVATLGSSDTLDVEPRFLIMQDGWEIFTEHPWIGRGPGAYTTLGDIPFVSDHTAAIYGIENFQTNAVLTILIDTGLIGLAVVAFLFYRSVTSLWKALKTQKIEQAEQKNQAILFALGTAALALLLGYQVSTGMWLGLTWYLGSLIIAGSLVTFSTAKTSVNKA